MNSRIKRKLRMLADPKTPLSERGIAKIASLKGNAKKYYDRLMRIVFNDAGR